MDRRQIGTWSVMMPTGELRPHELNGLETSSWGTRFIIMLLRGVVADDGPIKLRSRVDVMDICRTNLRSGRNAGFGQTSRS
jgi:hypothetical protein